MLMTIGSPVESRATKGKKKKVFSFLSKSKVSHHHTLKAVSIEDYHLLTGRSCDCEIK